MSLVKIRRIILFALTLSVLIALTGCGNNNPSSKVNGEGTTVISSLLNTDQPILGRVYSAQNDIINPTFFTYSEKDCYSSKDPSTCLLSILENTVTNKGSEKALAQLTGFSDNFSPFCNNVSMSLGKFVAIKKSSTIKITNNDPNKCGDAFSQGYFNYAISSSNADDLTLSEICSELDKSARWTCSNHLGAFFMNSLMKDPIKAAHKCYAIPSPDDSKGNHMTFRRACLSGAWHEFFNNSTVLDFLKSRKTTSSDIFSFCLGSERSSKEVCLQEDSNPFWVLPQFASVDEKFKSCRELGEIDLTDQCYFGMSRGVADAAKRDISKTYSTCIALKNINDKEYCFIAAGEAMDRNDFSTTAPSLCKSVNNSNYCLLNLGMMAYGLFSGDHNLALDFCKKLPQEQYASCGEGVFAGLNRISFVHAQPKTYADIFSKCAPESKTDIALCYRAATHGIGDHINSIKGVEGLQVFCDALSANSIDCSYSTGVIVGSMIGVGVNSKTCFSTTSVNGESCAKALGQYLSYSGSDSSKPCQELSANLREVCALSNKNASLV